MNQICISSDVQIDYMIVDCEDLPYVESVDITLLDEEMPFLQVRGGGALLEMKNKVQTTIEGILPTAIASGNANVDIKYKGQEYKLDLRDKRGFAACAVINLYDILIKAIEKEGNMYIYLRDAFLKDKRADILAFLRFKQGLRKEDLKAEMNAMWQRSNNNRNQALDTETLQLALDYLEHVGMVNFNQIKGEYQITSRGYLFR